MVRRAHGEHLHVAFFPLGPSSPSRRRKKGKEAEAAGEGVDVWVLEGGGRVEVEGMPSSMTGEGDGGRGVIQVLHFWKSYPSSSSAAAAAATAAVAAVVSSVTAALLPVV